MSDDIQNTSGRQEPTEESVEHIVYRVQEAQLVAQLTGVSIETAMQANLVQATLIVATQLEMIREDGLTTYVPDTDEIEATLRNMLTLMSQSHG